MRNNFLEVKMRWSRKQKLEAAWSSILEILYSFIKNGLSHKGRTEPHSGSSGLGMRDNQWVSLNESDVLRECKQSVHPLIYLFLILYSRDSSQPRMVSPESLCSRVLWEINIQHEIPSLMPWWWIGVFSEGRGGPQLQLFWPMRSWKGDLISVWA